MSATKTDAPASERLGRKTGRPCTTCSHPKRDEIERSLLTENATSVSSRFGIKRAALLRHQRDHLPEAILESAGAIVERRTVAWWRDVQLGVDAAKAKLEEGGNAFEVAASLGALSRLLQLNGRALKIIEPANVIVNVWQPLGVTEAEGKALLNAALDAKKNDRHALAAQASRMLGRYRQEFPERWGDILREMGVEDASEEAQGQIAAQG